MAQPPPCTYLSTALLAGMVLNATLGSSWADPLVGVAAAVVAAGKASKPGAATTSCALAASGGADPARGTDAAAGSYNVSR